jgi:nitroreductase
VANAPAAIALIAPNPQDERQRELIQYDLGHPTMSMMLAAADQETGTCHSAVSDQEHARKVLGFPDDRFCAYLISIGYPAGRPLAPLKRPNRRAFGEVVHREHW